MYVARILHSAGVCSSIQLRSVATYVYTCTNETHSPGVNPYLGSQHSMLYHDVKIGIKSCRMYFICTCTYLRSYPAAIVYLSRHLHYTILATYMGGE